MPSRIAYGSAELADLCRLAHPASGVGHVKAVVRALAREPSRVRTLLALRTLPVIEPRLSAAEHGRWREARWPEGGERLFGGHWAQAVIGTSAQEDDYLSGRHRQAVRTNIRRAREQGITAMRLDGYDEFAAASVAIYAGRDGGDEVLANMRSPDPPDRFAWYVAVAGANRTPVTIAAVALFGDLGVLAVMVGDLANPHAGHARYLLHTFVRGDLAGEGVRHLLVGSVLRESSGNQYFQRLLGYRICNVRPVLGGSVGGQQSGITTRLSGWVMAGPGLDVATGPPRRGIETLVGAPHAPRRGPISAHPRWPPAPRA